MSLRVILPALAAVFLFTALSSTRADDGPPIVIVSPDAGTTFAYGTIRNRALVWDPKTKMLIARVTFTDQRLASGQPNDDQHEFRLPGVTFDSATGIFSAKSAQGKLIPVAQIKKTLFFQHIEALPNARVRIMHPRGDITVVLEAIDPKDPAMHPKPKPGNQDGTHDVPIQEILN